MAQVGQIKYQIYRRKLTFYFDQNNSYVLEVGSLVSFKACHFSQKGLNHHVVTLK